MNEVRPKIWYAMTSEVWSRPVFIGQHPTDEKTLTWGGVSYCSWHSTCRVHKKYEIKCTDPDKYWDTVDKANILFFKEYYPLEKSEPKESAGWLSPEGEFYECKYYEHASLAEKICANKYNIISGERFLEGNDYIKIYDDGVLANTHVVTQSQLDTLFDIYQVSSKEFKDHIQWIFKHDPDSL